MNSPIEIWFPELNGSQRKRLKDMFLDVVGDSEEMVNVMIKMEHAHQLIKVDKLFGEEDETNSSISG
jgi:hypothetical protein